MLERDYDITMDAKNIRSLTFTQIDALSSAKPESSNSQNAPNEMPAVSPLIRYQFQHLVPTEPLQKMNSISGDANATPVFVVTPIDGSTRLLERVVSQLNAPVYGLQCTEHTSLTSITDLAKEYIKVIVVCYNSHSCRSLSDCNSCFMIQSYSFNTNLIR